MSYNDLLLYENPRRRHKRRNPGTGVKAAAKKWTQGVDAMDVAAGVAGMAAAFMVPPYVIKAPTTGSPTTTQKWQKVGVSAIAAIGAGYLIKQASPGAGKAAIIGGAAGVVAQALATFGYANIAPSSGGSRAPIAGARPASIAPGRYPAPAFSNEFNGVRLD